MAQQNHTIPPREQPASVKALNLPPNISCMIVKKRTISLEPIPVPILEPDGVLVRVMANGICGSDMHSYLGTGVAGRCVVEKSVMGHEASGEVIAVGELVTTHKPGDRVAIEPGVPCRRCVNCKAGRMSICLNFRYCAAPGTNGSLSRFFALPADMAPHLSDNIDWDTSGSIQPLAIGVQIGKRADIRAHQTIAIFGCGPIGLITAAVAHAYSASKIIAFDIRPSRVEFAKKYLSPLTGRPIIDHVYLVDKIPTFPGKHGVEIDEHDFEGLTVGDQMYKCAVERMTKVLKEVGLSEAGGVDRVIEASGAPDSMLHGVAIAKQGGIFLQVGLGPVQTHLIPTIAITNNELEFRGITRYTASCFPSAIDLLRRGVVDIKSLVTAVYPMSRAVDAFEAVASGKQIKVIIRNQEV